MSCWIANFQTSPYKSGKRREKTEQWSWIKKKTTHTLSAQLIFAWIRPDTHRPICTNCGIHKVCALMNAFVYVCIWISQLTNCQSIEDWADLVDTATNHNRFYFVIVSLLTIFLSRFCPPCFSLSLFFPPSFCRSHSVALCNVLSFKWIFACMRNERGNSIFFLLCFGWTGRVWELIAGLL